MAKIGKGSIKLPMFWGSYYEVYGGPYMSKPEGLTGVKMAVEINKPCTINIPTADYSIPNIMSVDIGLTAAVQLIAVGTPLYVGCMGGIGRTGLFLAVLAKAWGIADPVAFVRATYYGHAVETAEQQKFIKDYEVPKDVQKAISKARWKALLKFKKPLTIL